MLRLRKFSCQGNFHFPPIKSIAGLLGIVIMDMLCTPSRLKA